MKYVWLVLLQLLVAGPALAAPGDVQRFPARGRQWRSCASMARPTSKCSPR